MARHGSRRAGHAHPRLRRALRRGLDTAPDARGYAPAEGETCILFRPNPGGAAGAGGVEPAGRPGAEWLDARAPSSGDGAGYTGMTRMSKFPRLTLTAALLGAVALPAFAQGTTSPGAAPHGTAAQGTAAPSGVPHPHPV